MPVRLVAVLARQRGAEALERHGGVLVVAATSRPISEKQMFETRISHFRLKG
jgi:hypothetical protein